MTTLGNPRVGAHLESTRRSIEWAAIVRPTPFKIFRPNKDKFNERMVKYESMFFYWQGGTWMHDPFFICFGISTGR